MTCNCVLIWSFVSTARLGRAVELRLCDLSVSASPCSARATHSHVIEEAFAVFVTNVRGSRRAFGTVSRFAGRCILPTFTYGRIVRAPWVTKGARVGSAHRV
jgi:hypothetical protein